MQTYFVLEYLNINLFYIQMQTFDMEINETHFPLSKD